MATASAQARRASGRARSALRERLEARREEIEAAALTRVRAISDPAEVADPAYAEGLRAAVRAAVAYGIETTGREGSDHPIPVHLLAQARTAARAAIPLDTVLRRYFAGYSLLGHFILEEAGREGLDDGAELKRLLGVHAGLFDRLLAAVGEEHARETEARRASAGGRAAARIKGLLEGTMIDTAEIPYDFDARHIGIAFAGSPEAERILRELAKRIDCRLLLLPHEGAALSAWFGARRSLDPAELGELLASRLPAECVHALGEPGEGLVGWRLTYRQALAALTVARHGTELPVRYADVLMLAAALKDELLAESLRGLYLTPLKAERDGGAVLRETLLAYLGCKRNSASAAAILGLTRQAVNYRLRLIEERIGRPLSTCASEIEVALRLPP